MIGDLSRRRVLAVDTESNSLYVYREQVCLVQFSTGTEDYLVDPLAIRDLSPLRGIFSDDGIVKVFHAAEYDLICLKRDYGFEFRSIFDTMIAARTLGRSRLSLANLLEDEFGIRLDKRYQRANWGKRPLSPEMLAYARQDTHYLIPLRERMTSALEKQERLPLAEEDFRRMCQVCPPQAPNHNGDLPPRLGGIKDLTRQQEAVLWELFRYREKTAQEANLPPFRIYTNQALINLAVACPEDEKELAAVRDISPRQARRHAGGLIRAVRRGMQGEAPKKSHDHKPRPDERHMARLEALRQWRKNAGRQLGVESDVVMPREVMEAIAERNPSNLEQLQEAMQSIPWRFQRFGREIMEVLNPKEGK